MSAMPSGEAPDPDAAPEFAAGAPPAGDPWRSFRGVMAGTLILEAIVVLLALPVVAAGQHGLDGLSGSFLIGMAVVLVLLSGMQGRPRIIWVNLGVQVVFIAGALIHGAIGFIGVIFAAVWGLMIYLQTEVKRRQAGGLLPFQQSGTPPERD